MFSTVYRVTQKDLYTPPYMRMCDLRHNSDNDDLELITPHMQINTWQELEYRLDICQAKTGPTLKCTDVHKNLFELLCTLLKT